MIVFVATSAAGAVVIVFVATVVAGAVVIVFAATVVAGTAVETGVVGRVVVFTLVLGVLVVGEATGTGGAQQQHWTCCPLKFFLIRGFLFY